MVIGFEVRSHQHDRAAVVGAQASEPVVFDRGAEDVDAVHAVHGVAQARDAPAVVRADLTAGSDRQHRRRDAAVDAVTVAGADRAGLQRVDEGPLQVETVRGEVLDQHTVHLPVRGVFEVDPDLARRVVAPDRQVLPAHPELVEVVRDPVVAEAVAAGREDRRPLPRVALEDGAAARRDRRRNLVRARGEVDRAAVGRQRGDRRALVVVAVARRAVVLDVDPARARRRARRADHQPVRRAVAEHRHALVDQQRRRDLDLHRQRQCRALPVQQHVGLAVAAHTLAAAEGYSSPSPRRITQRVPERPRPAVTSTELTKRRAAAKPATASSTEIVSHSSTSNAGRQTT